MRFIAVDPGGMTGVAYQTDSDKLPYTWEQPTFEALNLVEQLIDNEFAMVVCESFIPRPGAKTWQPEAIESIGVVRYLARKADCAFELQSPADAKRFSTDEKLKKLGWWVPTPGGHINDAQRHLLLARVRHGDIDLGALT